MQDQKVSRETVNNARYGMYLSSAPNSSRSGDILRRKLSKLTTALLEPGQNVIVVSHDIYGFMKAVESVSHDLDSSN